MQTVSDAVRQLLDSYAKVTLAVYIDGEKLDVGVGTGSYTGACAGEDEFSFGNACAAGANITLAVSRPDLKEHRIKITWTVDGTEHPLITGQVANAKVTAGRTEVEAWDDMYFAGSKAFVIPEALTTDCTAAAAFTAVADSMGVSVETSALALLAGVTIPGGLSGLDSSVTNSAVAGHIAGLVGGNALMSRAGLLTIRQYVAVNWETEPYSGGASAENEAFSVTGITLQRKETTAEIGTDGTTTETTETAEYSAGDGSLMISNPLSSQAAADGAYAALSAVTIRPGDYSFPGGLLLEPGDIFTVHAMDDSYAVAVGSISMTFDGGVRSSVACGGGGEESAGGAKGAINEALSALIRDYAKFKKLETDNAKIVRAIIEELSVNSLYAHTIKLQSVSENLGLWSEEELNAFVETTVDNMDLFTMRSFGARMELTLNGYIGLNGYGTVTVFAGTDGDYMKYATAILYIGEDVYMRTAYSEGWGEVEGEWVMQWDSHWTSIRNDYDELYIRERVEDIEGAMEERLDVVLASSDFASKNVKISYLNEIPLIFGSLKRTNGGAIFNAYLLAYNHVSQFTKAYIDGSWSPAEWVNPPMLADTEYLTSERYLGEAISRKIDSTTGRMLWKTSGDWQTYAKMMGAFPSFQRILTADDDMDSITDDGIYVYSTASVPANAPFANAAVVMVFGNDSTTTQKVQIGIRYGEGGHFKFRALFAGSWFAWAEVLNSVNGPYELLWENASKTSSFAEQTIDCDTAAYSHLLVVCGYNKSQATGQTTIPVWLRDKGNGDTATTLTVDYITSSGTITRPFRKMAVRSGRAQITFGGGCKYDGTASDDNVIPYYIYGVKGVNNP